MHFNVLIHFETKNASNPETGGMRQFYQQAVGDSFLRESKDSIHAVTDSIELNFWGDIFPQSWDSSELANAAFKHPIVSAMHTMTFQPANDSPKKRQVASPQLAKDLPERL